MSGRISILMVNHNGGEVLAETLEHLDRVRDEWHQLILADNGSTDGSLLRSTLDYPELVPLKLGANLGFGTANNRAAGEATGEYLLLLNSDAWPEPGCLTRLGQVLDREPRAGWVSPRLQYPNGRPQFHWAPTTSVLGEAVQLVRNRFERFRFVHDLRLGEGWFTAACALVRREAFEEVGGFDEDFFLYFEDVDLCLRLRRAGWRLTDAPGVTATHVKGGSQDTTTPGIDYRLGQARYYCKHRPEWEQRFLRRKILAKLRDPEQRILLERVYASRCDL